MQTQRILKIFCLTLVCAIVADAGNLVSAPAATVLTAPYTATQYVQAQPQTTLLQPAHLTFAQPQFVQAAQPAALLSTGHVQKTVAAAPAIPLSQPLSYDLISYSPAVAAVPAAAKVLSPVPTYVSAPRKLVTAAVPLRAPVQNRAPAPPPRQPPPPPPPQQPPRPLPSSADEGPPRRSGKVSDRDRGNPQITIILHAAAVAPRPAGLSYLAGAHAPVVSAAAPAVISAPQEIVYAAAPQQVVAVDPGLHVGAISPQIAVLASGLQQEQQIQTAPSLSAQRAPRPAPRPAASLPQRSSVTYSREQGPPPAPAPSFSSPGGRRGGYRHDNFARAYRVQEQPQQKPPPPPSYQQGPQEAPQLSAEGPGPQQDYGGGAAQLSAGQEQAQYGGEIAKTGALLTGFYGFTDPLGLFQRVDYVSDQQGYRATVNAAEQQLPQQEEAQYRQEPAQLSAQEINQQQQDGYEQSDQVTATAAGQVASAKVAVYPATAPALRYKVYQ